MDAAFSENLAPHDIRRRDAETALRTLESISSRDCRDPPPLVLTLNDVIMHLHIVCWCTGGDGVRLLFTMTIARVRIQFHINSKSGRTKNIGKLQIFLSY